MNQIDLKPIAESNSVLLDSIINNIIISNKLDINRLIKSSIEDLKKYINILLNQVKYSNLELLKLQWDIKAHHELLICYQNTLGLTGENYDSIGTGKNTGLKPNNVEKRQIELIQMRKDQQNRIENYNKLEKELNDKNSNIESFINLLPQLQYSAVLHATYFNNKSNSEIEKDFGYDTNYVDQARYKGIRYLCKILRFHLLTISEKFKK